MAIEMELERKKKQFVLVGRSMPFLENAHHRNGFSLYLQLHIFIVFIFLFIIIFIRPHLHHLYHLFIIFNCSSVHVFIIFILHHSFIVLITFICAPVVLPHRLFFFLSSFHLPCSHLLSPFLPFISSFPLSSHLISSHLVPLSSHLPISSHFVPSRPSLVPSHLISFPSLPSHTRSLSSPLLTSPFPPTSPAITLVEHPSLSWSPVFFLLFLLVPSCPSHCSFPAFTSRPFPQPFPCCPPSPLHNSQYLSCFLSTSSPLQSTFCFFLLSITLSFPFHYGLPSASLPSPFRLPSVSLPFSSLPAFALISIFFSLLAWCIPS
eukprot:m.177382 g.177382  ORF g.177382 m.177382 type:complete len:320 (-) comp16571_c3_seq3:117-1076(-)